MVMTFVLTPLSHYNSITKSHARFLLSLLEDLSIDFPYHFNISIIDVYRDTATCDKLIFRSAITRILRHFSIPIPDSPYFTVMGAISIAYVRPSKAQLQVKWLRTETTNPPASTIPSTSAPFSSGGDVTFEAIIAQLQRMDARLDILSDELCQVNTRVSCIARRQARLNGFAPSPSPSPEASADKDGDDGANDDDEDENVSSSSDEEMMTPQ